MRQRHGGERGDQGEERAAQYGRGAHQPRQERARECPGQIADVVGGGEVGARAGGESGLCLHQRQDRCVDEPSDAHAGRERGPGLGDVEPRGARAAARGTRADGGGGGAGSAVLLPACHGPKGGPPAPASARTGFLPAGRPNLPRTPYGCGPDPDRVTVRGDIADPATAARVAAAGDLPSAAAMVREVATTA